MAIREELILDLGRAIAQIDDLEQELDGLLQPVEIPVEFKADQAIREFRSDVANLDAKIDLDVDDASFKAISRELGISEDQAAELGRELSESVRKSTLLEDDLQDVARQLGLSEREARDFAAQMRKAAGAADDLNDETGLVASGFGSLKNATLALGGAFAGVSAARGLITFFGESINAASDLAESTSKAQVVFGEFFDEIANFADTAPQALGLARREALEFTGTFGNLFVALGLTQQAAADLAPDIVQLGADLASFNNIEVTDALEKLRAGLVGEAEPLRALGVNLSAAAVEAKAVALGLVDANGAITDAAKVQARYALILEQTTTAQGDFERTSDGMANKLRQLNAAVETAKEDFGQALIPALEDLIPVAENVIGSLADLAINFGILTGAVDETVGAIRKAAFDAKGFEGVFAAVALELKNIEPPFGLPLIGREAATVTNALDNLAASGVNLKDAFRLTGREIEILRAGGFSDLREEFGLTEDDIRRLLDILDEQQAAVNAASIDAGIAADNQARYRAEIRGSVRPTFDLGEAVAFAADALQEFELGRLTVQLDGIRSGLAETQAAFDSFDATPFDEALAGAFEAGREAADKLGSAFDEAETSFADFLQALEDEVAARAAFFDNIVTLFELGFDDLAEAFLDAGIKSAGALADGLSDPDLLAEAERQLEEDAKNIADATLAALVSQLEGEEISANIRARINIIAPELNAFSAGFGGNIPVVPAGRDTSSVPGPSTVQNFTFYDTPSPTTDIQRITSSIGNLP